MISFIGSSQTYALQTYCQGIQIMGKTIVKIKRMTNTNTKYHYLRGGVELGEVNPAISQNYIESFKVMGNVLFLKLGWGAKGFHLSNLLP